MDQKKLINLYNSIFDDSESETEIEDSVKDSHDELNIALSEKNQPELFHCILNMMDDNNYPHKRNDKLTASELLKIDKIEFREVKFETGWVNYPSYFQDFNPEDGDFSIIFKYLRNIKVLTYGCFGNCSHLKKIIIPKFINLIEDAVFNNCENLEEITFNMGNIKQGDWGGFCCSGCYNLTKVTFNNKITFIPIKAFDSCKKLSKIIIPDTITKIGGGCFKDCENLKFVKLPKFLTKINEIVFGNCYSLKHIKLPENLIEIGRDAFYGCINLESIEIPKNVNLIETYAFGECQNLKKITILSNNILIDGVGFRCCNKLKILMVPKDFKFKLFKKGEVLEYKDLSKNRYKLFSQEIFDKVKITHI